MSNILNSDASRKDQFNCREKSHCKTGTRFLTSVSTMIRIYDGATRHEKSSSFTLHTHCKSVLTDFKQIYALLKVLTFFLLYLVVAPSFRIEIPCRIS